MARGKRQHRMEHPHRPSRGGDHQPGQGRRRQPAKVAAEEDNAGASAGEVQVLREPRDARGKLDRDEQTHGPGAEKEEADDLVSSEAEKETAEHTADKAEEDQDKGSESAWEEDATEPSS